MSIHTDNAIDSAENDMKEKETRGPRAKYFFCIAWKTKDHANVYEGIEALNSDGAKEIFTTKHGFEPSVIDCGQSFAAIGGGSGYYLAKGTCMSDAQRISVTVSAEQMSCHTTTNVKAEFSGWVVYGNGIKGFDKFEDDELVQILFSRLIDPNNKVPKPKLKKNEAVRMADLNVLTKTT